MVEELGIVTCSNDETIKLWSLDLDEIQSYSYHPGFIYSVRNFGEGHYISVGENRSLVLAIYGNSEQTIPHTDVLWDCANTSSGDIVTAGADGFTRVFSKDPSRWLSEEERTAFQNQVAEVQM